MNEPFAINIPSQGEVLVNSAVVVERSEKIILVTVDLRTKYAEIGGIFSASDEAPGIIVEASKDSLYTRDLPGLDTFINFPSLDENWSIFAMSIFKYSLQIAFHKE